MLSCSEIKEIETLTIEPTEEFLLANSISIVCEPMAYDLKAIAIHRGDWYQIRINDLLPDNQKWIALLHELYHIANNDFGRLDSVEKIEAENPY